MDDHVRPGMSLPPEVTGFAHETQGSGDFPVTSGGSDIRNPISSQLTRSADDGAAMFLVIGFLVVLMIVSASMFTLIHVTLKQANAGEKRQQCLGLAEAGVDVALAHLLAGQTQYRGEAETPLGDGAFSVEVVAGDQAQAYRIHSTGLMRHGQFVLAQAQVVVHAGLSADGRLRIMQWEEVR